MQVLGISALFLAFATSAFAGQEDLLRLNDNEISCDFANLNKVDTGYIRTVIDGLRSDPDTYVCAINTGGRTKGLGDVIPNGFPSRSTDDDRGWSRAGSCDTTDKNSNGLIRIQTWDYMGNHFCLKQGEIADAADAIISQCETDGQIRGFKQMVGDHWVEVGRQKEGTCDEHGQDSAYEL